MALSGSKEKEWRTPLDEEKIAAATAAYEKKCAWEDVKFFSKEQEISHGIQANLNNMLSAPEFKSHQAELEDLIKYWKTTTHTHSDTEFKLRVEEFYRKLDNILDVQATALNARFNSYLNEVPSDHHAEFRKIWNDSNNWEMVDEKGDSNRTELLYHFFLKLGEKMFADQTAIDELANKLLTTQELQAELHKTQSLLRKGSVVMTQEQFIIAYEAKQKIKNDLKFPNLLRKATETFDEDVKNYLAESLKNPFQKLSDVAKEFYESAHFLQLQEPGWLIHFNEMAKHLSDSVLIEEQQFYVAYLRTLLIDAQVREKAFCKEHCPDWPSEKQLKHNEFLEINRAKFDGYLESYCREQRKTGRVVSSNEQEWQFYKDIFAEFVAGVADEAVAIAKAGRGVVTIVSAATTAFSVNEAAKNESLPRRILNWIKENPKKSALIGLCIAGTIATGGIAGAIGIGAAVAVGGALLTVAGIAWAGRKIISFAMTLGSIIARGFQRHKEIIAPYQRFQKAKKEFNNYRERHGTHELSDNEIKHNWNLALQEDRNARAQQMEAGSLAPLSGGSTASIGRRVSITSSHSTIPDDDPAIELSGTIDLRPVAPPTVRTPLLSDQDRSANSDTPPIADTHKKLPEPPTP
jgi:hypothetical protein